MKKLIQKIRAALRRIPSPLQPIKPKVEMQEFDDSNLLDWSKIVAKEIRDGHDLPPIQMDAEKRAIQIAYNAGVRSVPGSIAVLGPISEKRAQQKLENARRVR